MNKKLHKYVNEIIDLGTDMINTFNADDPAHMAEIIDLRSAGDRDSVTAVMCGE